MRKYAKPIILTETITDINEKVFLANSGDPWGMGNCFVVLHFQRDQTRETGRDNQVWELEAVHTCKKTWEHINYAQYIIIKLNAAIPLNSVVTCDSMANGGLGEVGGGGYLVKFKRENRINNPGTENPEGIGLGSLSFHWDESWDLIDPNLIDNLTIDKIYFNDIGEQLPVNSPNPYA